MATPSPGVKTAVKTTTGGFNSATIYSGSATPALTAAPGAVAVGSDVLLFSGTGRLDTVLVHQHTAAFVSGLLPVVFYDAHAPVAGGPIYASGHKLLAYIPFIQNITTASFFGTSGVVPNYAITWGTPVQVGAPFFSGLCCASIRSGQPGFTVTWTAEKLSQ